MQFHRAKKIDNFCDNKSNQLGLHKFKCEADESKKGCKLKERKWKKYFGRNRGIVKKIIKSNFGRNGFQKKAIQIKRKVW